MITMDTGARKILKLGLRGISIGLISSLMLRNTLLDALFVLSTLQRKGVIS